MAGWIVALTWNLSNPQQVVHRDSGHHIGCELIAAGMLIIAGGHDGKPLDYDELERWTEWVTSAG